MVDRQTDEPKDQHQPNYSYLVNDCGGQHCHCWISLEEEPQQSIPRSTKSNLPKAKIGHKQHNSITCPYILSTCSKIREKKDLDPNDNIKTLVIFLLSQKFLKAFTIYKVLIVYITCYVQRTMLYGAPWYSDNKPAQTGSSYQCLFISL